VSATLRFGPAVRFALPRRRCCNCGSIVGLRDADLLAPVPDGGGLPDRARRSLRLDVSICAASACARSLRRAPPSWIVLAGLGLLAALHALALARILLGDATLPMSSAVFAGFFGAGTFAACAWRWLRRPDPPQSSAFAPIRIRRLRHVGGEVRQIAFDFTQPDCAREFELAHAALIAGGSLASRCIAGR
jgi:hypothetical protein